MKNHPNLPPLKGHRFPRSIVSYAVWAYFRVNMSLRDVEDLLAVRGIAVSYETIRSWVTKFGQQYARSIQRDRPKPNDKWHLDEVVIAIKGRKHWLWRFVDANGPSHRCKQRLPGNGRPGYPCPIAQEYQSGKAFHA
jgi:putative transposase